MTQRRILDTSKRTNRPTVHGSQVPRAHGNVVAAQEQIRKTGMSGPGGGGRRGRKQR